MSLEPTQNQLQDELKEVRSFLEREIQKYSESNDPQLLEDIEQSKLLIEELENEILYNF